MADSKVKGKKGDGPECPEIPPGRRYQILRMITYGLTLALILVVPGLKLIKFDIPAGVYYLWGEPAPTLRVIQAFLYFTLVTLLVVLWSTFPFGRMFCGWSCPGGQLARLSLWLNKGWGKRRPVSRHAISLVVGFLFALLGLNWFTHLGILWEVGAPGFTGAWIWAGILTLLFYVEAAFVGFFWCEKLCPYGWYLGIAAQKNRLRIGFVNIEESCGECAACAKACPVELDPRAPDFDASRCLTCGTCLDVCAKIFTKLEGTQPLNWAHRLPTDLDSGNSQPPPVDGVARSA